MDYLPSLPISTNKKIRKGPHMKRCLISDSDTNASGINGPFFKISGCEESLSRTIGSR